jgi:hypothetical protein
VQVELTHARQLNDLIRPLMLEFERREPAARS